MEAVLRTIAGVAGGLLALAMVSSEIRTVIVPRAERSRLTSVVFRVIRRVFVSAAGTEPDYRKVDRILARFAPTALVGLMVTWAGGVILAYALIYLAGGMGVVESVQLSGSSFATLGFRTAESDVLEVVAVSEALLGLFLVALVISFLPTMYGHFSTREALVAKLGVRANTPPAPADLLVRAYRIRGLDSLDDMWDEWEDWFTRIEESHTSYPALAHFRSPEPERSWLTAAGCVLDAASLHAALMPQIATWHSGICIRAGYTCLRSVADYFGIDHDPDPRPDDPISIRREEFDELYEQLTTAGLPVTADCDTAWRDYAGWRVNYDTVLVGLCHFIGAPPAPWSSDRPPPVADRAARPRRRRRAAIG